MSVRHKFSVSRRKLLLAGAGGTVALGMFGAASWGALGAYRATWIEAVIRDNLPKVELDAPSLRSFIAEISVSERLQRRSVKAAVFADRFVPWLPASISKARDGLEGLARHVLTEYLIGSNFFRVPDPKREKIVYSGRAVACINPFRQPRALTNSSAQFLGELVIEHGAQSHGFEGLVHHRQASSADLA